MKYFEFETKREHKHIDIEISGKNGDNYIIENKVKDILQQEQYEKINELCIRDEYKGVILFSLMGNNLELLNNHGNWKEIGYKRITNCLRKYDFKDDYLRGVVDDYCSFVNNMIILINSELKNCDRYVFHYGNKFTYELLKIKIHDIFFKYGMSIFINYFRKKYKDIIVGYSVNNGKGTMDFYRVINGTGIGIQIENLDYRRTCVCNIKTRDRLEKNGWFDSDYRSSRNKPYLEYSTKDKDKKVYYQLQGNKIENMEFKKLSKLIYNDLLSIDKCISILNRTE